MLRKSLSVLGLGTLLSCPGPITAQDASMVLNDGGIQFPDGSVLGSAAGSYQSVLVVAKRGGHYTSIQSALDAIGDELPAATEESPFLVWVAPGEYEEQVTMEEWVDIQGAGEALTTITFTYTTLFGADNAELRSLRVESTGGYNAVAIFNAEASPKLSHVTASASGGTYTFGVYNFSSSPTMANVTANGSGGKMANCGVSNHSSSSPTMTNVTTSASGGTYAYGVQNAASSPKMTNVVAGASGATNNRGVYSGGFDSSGSSLEIHRSILEASGGKTNYAVYVDGESTAKVAYSQVVGGVGGQPANCTCIGAYDGSFASLDPNCQ